jgi:hypothetical protein
MPAFGEAEQEFLAHLTALDGVTVWVGNQGWGHVDSGRA